MKQIEYCAAHPFEMQERLFYRLLKSGKQTVFGKEHNFGGIRNLDDFQRLVPVSEYHDLLPYIERIRKGEQNVLWSSEIKLFSKSSGTTATQSKYILISREALRDCHFKAGRDIYTIYCALYPDNKLFSGYALGMGGHLLKNNYNGTLEGDLSAILMTKLPKFAQKRRKPSLNIALMDEWESKIEKMADATIPENITHALGVPSWTLLLMRRILEKTGKEDIREVWPNFEAFFHGGVRFEPYKSEYQRIIPHSDMRYIQTYNASEGYFAIQERRNADDMLLLLDNGIYYEFMPASEFGKENPKLLSLDQIELHTNYGLVITTNSGLWRYLIGDTVIFTSKNPYRIRVSGRTRFFINAVGEELILDNVEKALQETMKQVDFSIEEYMGAPSYAVDHQKARHEWIFEFSKQPKDHALFTEIFDRELQNTNSDYAAKRYKDMILDRPVIHFALQGTFYEWMKQRGKLGGQNKVPRLSNDRQHIDSILPLL
jgi:hypothetical protein